MLLSSDSSCNLQLFATEKMRAMHRRPSPFHASMVNRYSGESQL
jgi:hypothetical protein